MSISISTRNISEASHFQQSPAHGSFTNFAHLPVELRLRIWHHAISVRRIVEMEKIPSWDVSSPEDEDEDELHTPPDRWHYTIKNLPPLLSTCSESRQEVLKACRGNPKQPDSQGQPAPAWIRFDYDILHLKARTWYDNYGRATGHRWYESDIRDSKKGEKSLGRNSPMRDYFKNIQTLAINRELCFMTMDREASIIRQFFPNLKLLIILIEHTVDIGRKRCQMWKLHEQKLAAGESSDVDPEYLKWAFTTASTGPFIPVSSLYQQSIERRMRRGLEKEEKRFGRKHYVAPQVVVMGCSLPPGLEIAACGRMTARGLDE
ncbi:hypothetical protein HYFRA_00003065 [Hymenoscyphus fraxineus]|uniref:2EXR domain-containing protein n=1 Tax=Hymenoscyphus fraxineus TaxID=746836 RepID=A0A9N9KQE1_9HELO|nr:hypothetical protein HYFRA_00003065 [Hymenoscyphus fraxineus]